MQPLTALYYPHIAIENDRLLKNALLLWDNVELVCPFGGFPRYAEDEGMRAAFDTIAQPLKPTNDEKYAAHEAILELAESDLPDWFFPDRVTMLSIMADCCAGGTKQLVTDEIDSYVALDRYLKVIAGAKAEEKKKSAQERLVTLSLSTADVSKVDLSALVAVRRREDEEPRLRKMRHAYRRKLDGYVERLRIEARSARDVSEIERLFQEEVADDIGLLKEELKDEGKKILFSKELGTAAVAIAGTFVEPVSSSLLAAGALYRAKVNYRTARNRTLENHSMSWLYEVQRLKAY